MNQWFTQFLDIFKNITDILLVWGVIFILLKAFQNNAKTLQIIKGIVYVLLAKIVAEFLDLTALNLILNYVLNWGVLAVIVIFQPELRQLLEKLGQSRESAFSSLSLNQKESLLKELIPAAMALSETKTGALISIARHDSLDEYIKTGKLLNSNISKELLTSIFVTTTPLHDGAVIISGDMIVCASAYLPSTDTHLPTRFGSRHRAGVGLSEVTDALTLVISEETGSISVAEYGKLTIFENVEDLTNYLDLALIIKEEQTGLSNVPFWKRVSFPKMDNSSKSIQDILSEQHNQMKLPIDKINQSKKGEKHDEK